VVGLVIDSILFLQIAFGSLDFIEDQIIGMLWTTVFAVVVLLALRRWVIPRYSRPADEPTVPRSPSGGAGPPGKTVPCLGRWHGHENPDQLRSGWATAPSHRPYLAGATPRGELPCHPKPS
jgi:hypothetical protein